MDCRQLASHSQQHNNNVHDGTKGGTKPAHCSTATPALVSSTVGAPMATTTVVEAPAKAPETHELRTVDEETIEAGASPAQNVTEAVSRIELTPRVQLKIFSAALAFFNAGINDGSLGALIPYILRQYDISTGWMAIPYGISFFGWLLAAAVIAYIRLYWPSAGSWCPIQPKPLSIDRPQL
ncbi:hypothetical protein BST61_g9814 [Cercospora zeina]